MLTYIDISLLPEDLRKRVLDRYRVALKDPARLLTYEEAAWLYGFTSASLRTYVHHGRIKVVGRGHRLRITHQAMREGPAQQEPQRQQATCAEEYADDPYMKTKDYQRAAAELR